MQRIADLIHRVLSNAADEHVARSVRSDVHELTAAFPLYTGAEEAAGRL